MSKLAALRAPDPTLASFIPLVWWIIIIKVLVIFLFLLLWQILMIWAERRIIGRMQNRPGPNRWGPFGLLQPVADALKLPLKEDIVPRQVDKLLFTLAPILSAAPALISFAIIPMGPDSLDLRCAHPVAADRPPGRGATGAGHELDRHLRHRAGRLVVGRAVLAARRAAILGPADQLRDRHGPVLRGRVPVRGDAVDHRHRQRPGARLVRVGAAALVPDLRDHDGRGDQPAAVRPAGGRRRTGRRVPHRVLLDEVHAVLPGRVREHAHGLGPGHHAVPGWLAGPVADLPVGRGQPGLVPDHLVPDQDRAVRVPLHLAARLAAPGPLRPADGARLEGPDPDLDRLAAADRHRSGLAAGQAQRGGLRGRRHRAGHHHRHRGVLGHRRRTASP